MSMENKRLIQIVRKVIIKKQAKIVRLLPAIK